MADIEIKKIKRQKPTREAPGPVDGIVPEKNPRESAIDLASAAQEVEKEQKKPSVPETDKKATPPPLQELATSVIGQQAAEQLGQSAANLEQDWSRQLTQNRIDDLRNRNSFKETFDGMVGRLENPELEMEGNENLQNLKKMQQAITSGSRLSALKAGIEIGADLRNQIATGSFQGFLFAMGLAITKDLWDLISEWFDVGLTGMLFNIIVTSALLMIVMFQGIWFKRFIIKRFWRRYIAVIVAEFIPFLSFFPWWSISVFLVKRTADKKRKQHEAALSDLEKDLKNLRVAN